jgi:hypothetical protein
MSKEKFNELPPFPVCTDIEIERDEKNYPEHVGKLWLGSTWFSVAEARELRDWLNKVIP